MLDVGIFGVNVPNGVLQCTHGSTWITALPDQVRRIKVGVNLRSRGIAQLQEHFGIVNDEAWMHLQSNFVNAMFSHEFGGVRPVRNHHVLPLVFENVEILGRPRTSAPIRLLVARRAAWTAAEGGNHSVL